jgi:hypothetical protein
MMMMMIGSKKINIERTVQLNVIVIPRLSTNIVNLILVDNQIDGQFLLRYIYLNRLRV